MISCVCGLVTSLFPVQGFLPTMYRIRKTEREAFGGGGILRVLSEDSLPLN
jgi:hypothetical protein